MKKKTPITIPTSKVKRASKMVAAGLKVGGNYLKYYSQKVIKGEGDKEALDEANAEDIYNSLSELKGSALKAAQMISMDQNMLPHAFAEKFRMAQHKAPPLSYPLVERTFQKTMGKKPHQIFDSFSKEAVNAASIGQVHQASIGTQKFAVKVQYPGVADSVDQDLNMAMPIAAKIMGVKQKDLKQYVDEVRDKLIEETNYKLELERSIQMTDSCKHLSGVIFPTYYPKYCGSRVITMDWIDGTHIADWIKTDPSQQERNHIGQKLWDLYQFQIHELKSVHADPHPGNFLITGDSKLAVIDFGCVKYLPDSFYKLFVQLLDADIFKDETKLMTLYKDLGFVLPDDKEKDVNFYVDLLNEGIQLLTRPMQSESFDFADPLFFEAIYKMANHLMKSPELRKGTSARGPRDAIYLNRTYFGLYTLLHQLKANVQTARDFSKIV